MSFQRHQTITTEANIFRISAVLLSICSIHAWTRDAPNSSFVTQTNALGFGRKPTRLSSTLRGPVPKRYHMDLRGGGTAADSNIDDTGPARASRISNAATVQLI